MKAQNIDQLNQDFKQNAKTKHKIVGIQTWHLNLNPLAMSQLAFSKGGKTTDMNLGHHVDWRGPFATQAGALMVEITTNKGLKGYGLGGGGLAGELVIDQHLQYFLIDQDPLDVVQIWDHLYHISSIYGRRGLVIYALSGIDLALWDLCGKILDQPVYALITDQPRSEIPAYATGNDIVDYVEQGFSACKIPLRFGLAEGELGFQKNLEIVQKSRDLIGEKVDLMVDIYLRWDVDYTLRFAESTTDLNLKWIEEPIALDNYRGMAELVDTIDSTWIVSGEHEFTRYGFRELLQWKAADMIQPDVSWAGGFGECLRIAQESANLHIPTWPHQAGTPWGLHLTACLPLPAMAETFGLNHLSRTQSVESEIYRRLRPQPKDGLFKLNDLPGFGLDLSPELLDAYAVDTVIVKNMKKRN